MEMHLPASATVMGIIVWEDLLGGVFCEQILP